MPFLRIAYPRSRDASGELSVLNIWHFYGLSVSIESDGFEFVYGRGLASQFLIDEAVPADGPPICDVSLDTRTPSSACQRRHSRKRDEIRNPIVNSAVSVAGYDRDEF